jgi:hypothetical protein
VEKAMTKGNNIPTAKASKEIYIFLGAFFTNTIHKKGGTS